MYARKLDKRMQLKDHYTPHNGPLIRILSQFMTNFDSGSLLFIRHHVSPRVPERCLQDRIIYFSGRVLIAIKFVPIRYAVTQRDIATSPFVSRLIYIQ